MPLSAAQTAAIKEVIQVILTQTARGKRQVAAMFMDLVDRQEWPQYYEVRPSSFLLPCNALIISGDPRAKMSEEHTGETGKGQI